MRTALFVVLSLVLLPTKADALDITACGTIVPPGETGTLQADLDCGTGPGFENVHGVILGRRSKLELTGHSISAHTGVDVFTATGNIVRGEIRGPGEIKGCNTGISGYRGTLRMFDVSVHDNLENGVDGIFLRIVGENLSFDANGADGIFARSLNVQNVTANGNTGLGRPNSGSGIHVYSIRGENVVTNHNAQDGLVYGFSGRIKGFAATNNGVYGAAGARLFLRDSTVTDNGSGDISGFQKPHLVNTTCAVSFRPGGTNWGVCAND
jgi:hypothetical protein